MLCVCVSVCVCMCACVSVCTCVCVRECVCMCVHPAAGLVGWDEGLGGEGPTSPRWSQFLGLSRAPAHCMSPDCTQGSCLWTEGVGTRIYGAASRVGGVGKEMMRELLPPNQAARPRRGLRPGSQHSLRMSHRAPLRLTLLASLSPKGN